MNPLRSLAHRLPLPTSWYFPVEEGDVALASFPRSGNTWVSHILTHLLLPDHENIDFNTTDRTVIDIHQATLSVVRRSRQQPPAVKVFKTHECYNPRYERVVLLVRDPRSVAVSFFFFLQKMRHLPTDSSAAAFDSFFARFLAQPYRGFEAYGTWGAHTASWLGGCANSPAAHIIVRYEDLLTDTATEIRRIADLANIPYTPATLERALHKGSFAEMRALETRDTEKQPAAWGNVQIPFIRKGSPDDWRNYLTPDHEARLSAAFGSVMRAMNYDTVHS